MTHHYDTLFVYDYVPKGTSIILFIGTWITKEYVPISSETYPYKTIIYILIFSKNRVQMCVKHPLLKIKSQNQMCVERKRMQYKYCKKRFWQNEWDVSIKIYEMCVNKVRCKEKIQHIHTCVRHEYKHVIYAEICV